MKTKSYLRIEEYKMLSKLSVDGDILDIGGSKKSGYHELILGQHKIITGNIDPSYGADILFDAQKKWPFDDARFSCVLFINVLEHLFEYNTAISEAYRVLGGGGKVVGVVPFMFNLHGSPSDYFRYTRFALERMFLDAGFKSIEIKELGSGAFGVIYHALIGFVKWQWLVHLLIYLCKKLDSLILFIKPENKMSARFMPIGYYFYVVK